MENDSLIIGPKVMLEDIVKVEISIDNQVKIIGPSEYDFQGVSYVVFGPDVIDGVRGPKGHMLLKNDKYCIPAVPFPGDDGFELVFSEKIFYDKCTGRLTIGQCGYDLRIDPTWIRSVYDKENMKNPGVTHKDDCTKCNDKIDFDE